MTTTRGLFVWHDLLTSDLEAAKRFYGEVAGWKATKWPEGDYQLFNLGSEQVAGLMPLPEASRKAGVSAFWMGHVATDDVDATAKKANALGGVVHTPPQDIPTVGRFAVLMDPQGAMFAVFKPIGAQAPPSRQGPGRFSWAELNTTDGQQSWKFYSELFGWKKTSSMDMGEGLGEYFKFGQDPQTSIGGMSNAATMMNTPPHWLHYVNVPNADEMAQRIPKLGGKVLNGPMDIPGGDRIAQCIDSQGALFAIFSPGKK
jgi:uncharacterized protein